MKSACDLLIPMKTTKFLNVDSQGRVFTFSLIGDVTDIGAYHGGLKFLASSNFVYCLTTNKPVKNRWQPPRDWEEIVRFLENYAVDYGIVRFMTYSEFSKEIGEKS